MPASSSLTTALIYTRVSTEDQAREGISLDAQLTMCRQYVAQRGWLIGAEYQDILSGTRDDRPKYQALLADVRRRAHGQSVAVVVARLDRFGRRVLERVRCREELKALGVATHSVREGGEVSDLVANILASVAQEEVRLLAERVSIARRHIAARGWHMSSRAPWGYRWRPAFPEERAAGAPQIVLEVDPAAAPYVRELFTRVAAGESVQALARWAAALPASARGERALYFSSVRTALSAGVYVARQRQGDSDVLARPAGHWPALIDDATFRTVQRRIARHALLPRQASGHYLLTGLIRCPSCGARMGMMAPRSLRQPKYRCRGRQAGAAAPDPTCLKTAIACQVEAEVLADATAVVEVLANARTDLAAAVHDAWEALQQPADPEVDTRIMGLEREAKQARERLVRATELYVDGNLDRDGYDGMCAKARANLDAAESELARLRQRALPSAELPPLDEALAATGGWARLLHATDVAMQREVLAMLIERVVPVRVGYGRYRAETTWTALGRALREVAARLLQQAAA